MDVVKKQEKWSAGFKISTCPVCKTTCLGYKTSGYFAWKIRIIM